MDTTVTTLVAAAQQRGMCDFFNISCDSIALRCDVGVRFSLVLVTDLRDLDLKEIRARAARACVHVCLEHSPLFEEWLGDDGAGGGIALRVVMDEKKESCNVELRIQ